MSNKTEAYEAVKAKGLENIAYFKQVREEFEATRVPYPLVTTEAEYEKAVDDILKLMDRREKLANSVSWADLPDSRIDEEAFIQAHKMIERQLRDVTTTIRATIEPIILEIEQRIGEYTSLNQEGKLWEAIDDYAGAAGQSGSCYSSEYSDEKDQNEVKRDLLISYRNLRRQMALVRPLTPAEVH